MMGNMQMKEAACGNCTCVAEDDEHVEEICMITEAQSFIPHPDSDDESEESETAGVEVSQDMFQIPVKRRERQRGDCR